MSSDKSEELLQYIQEKNRPVDLVELRNRCADEVECGDMQKILKTLISRGQLNYAAFRNSFDNQMDIFWINKSNVDGNVNSELQNKEKIASLGEKLKKLNDQFEYLNSESTAEARIDLLHRYNDAKDAGQILLGKKAEIEGVLTRDLYERYGLELTD